MRRIGILGAALAAAMLGQTVSAQSLSSNAGPAETPPSSYTGNQYVDSDGCVFIRAGVAGNVRWVPRVSRDRKVICGATPTRTARAAAPAQRTVTPAPTATRVVRAAPAAAPVVAAPRRVVAAAPVQTTRRVYQQPAAAPQAFTYANPSAVTTTRSNGVNFGGTCANRSASANRYTNTGSGVRCGSQGWNPSQEGRVVSNAPSRSATVAAVPRTTHTTQTQTRRVVVQAPRSLTHGDTDGTAYRQTWTDGRLNPTRGLRTTTGAQASVSGQAGGTWYPPRPSVSTRSYQPKATTVQRRSTSNAGSGHRFVQVGTFGNNSNAQRSARRLQQMGLPARIQSSGRYAVVLAGPFSSRSQLQSALNSARRNGFGDAFTRR